MRRRYDEQVPTSADHLELYSDIDLDIVLCRHDTTAADAPITPLT